MNTSQAAADRIVRAFVARFKAEHGELTGDTPLFGDGVGLDSLETAELSAVLEDELGTDPYSSGQMPRTLAEILEFYADGVVVEH